MKFNIIFRFAIFSSLLLPLASCKKTFFTDVNLNPQSPSHVVPSSLLSTVEVALGYTQGGDISRFSSLIMQQVYGNGSQSQSYYSYVFVPSDFDNLWPDYYTSVLENNDTLMHLSDAGGYNEYSGVSRILMAYSLQVGVDLWGSLPYSKALQGNANLHPAFDTDKGLYDTVTSLVNAGIAFLNNSDPGSLTPGSEDVIYGGDASKWIKFGHAIKARLAIHQSKGNAAMAATALTEVGLSFSSEADNAVYTFGTSETSANPWYQFNEQRPGDETFSNSTIASMLLGLNDPRYGVFIDSTNDGAQNLVSRHWGGLADYYGSINAPVEFITYEELQFINAEATLRTSGNIAQAQTYYQAAITNNFAKLGISAGQTATYLTANGILPGTVAAAIGQVATQEYIATYLNPETWTTWRRTGYPLLSPINGTAVPRRLLYPQSELSFNPANTPSVTIFAPKIFWDN